jgi:hypothetical protein
MELLLVGSISCGLDSHSTRGERRGGVLGFEKREPMTSVHSQQLRR